MSVDWVYRGPYFAKLGRYTHPCHAALAWVLFCGYVTLTGNAKVAEPADVLDLGSDQPVFITRYDSMQSVADQRVRTDFGLDQVGAIWAHLHWE